MTRFGALQRARLWLSYQRYALLSFAAGAAPLLLTAALAPESWAWWIPAVAIALAGFGFGTSIARRYPRKLRATMLAARRIETGRFSPGRLREYCGDPCFRVVAREILTRAGYTRRQRNEIVREFARDLRKPVFFLEVDHLGGAVRVDGNRVGSLAAPTANKGDQR